MRATWPSMPAFERRHRHVARRIDVAGVDVQAALIEIQRRLGIEPLGLGVVVGDGDELQEAGAVGIARQLVAVDRVPEPVHDLLALLVAEVGQVGVEEVVFQAQVPGLDAGAARHPDRRPRLLHRPRPDVDVAKLGVLAVEREHVGLAPGAQDQLHALAILLAQRRRRLPVAVRRVHRRADRKARDQPPAGHHVQHRHFLGDAGRRVVERDRIAHQHELDAGGPARQRRRHQVGRRHQAVGVLMVLVDADAVEADARRIFELVQVFVVGAVPDRRIEQLGGHIDPDRAMLFPEVVGQLGIGHQVEEVEFHRALMRADVENVIAP